MNGLKKLTKFKKKKKFIYLISPNRIKDKTFYKYLSQIFKLNKIAFFQLRLKKENKKRKLIIGKKIQKLCKKYNCVVLDKTKKSFVIQITALRREIDKLTIKLKPLGLISTSRTGAVAMTKGREIFIQN